MVSQSARLSERSSERSRSKRHFLSWYDKLIFNLYRTLQRNGIFYVRKVAHTYVPIFGTRHLARATSCH